MVTNQQHIIKRQILEVHLSDRVNAEEIRDRCAYLLKEKVMAEIGQLLSELCPPDELVRIDHLELDLESPAVEDLEYGLSKQVVYQLRKMLMKRLYHARTGQESEGIFIQKLDTKQAALGTQSSALRSLVFYWQNGISPWWEKGSAFDFEALLIAAWQSQPRALAHEVTALLAKSASRRRLIGLLETKDLFDLLEMIVPSNLPKLYEVKRELEKLSWWPRMRQIIGIEKQHQTSIDFAIVVSLFSTESIGPEQNLEMAFLNHLQGDFPDQVQLKEWKHAATLAYRKQHRLLATQATEQKEAIKFSTSNPEERLGLEADPIPSENQKTPALQPNIKDRKMEVAGKMPLSKKTKDIKVVKDSTYSEELPQASKVDSPKPTPKDSTVVGVNKKQQGETSMEQKNHTEEHLSKDSLQYPMRNENEGQLNTKLKSSKREIDQEQKNGETNLVDEVSTELTKDQTAVIDVEAHSKVEKETAITKNEFEKREAKEDTDKTPELHQSKMIEQQKNHHLPENEVAIDSDKHLKLLENWQAPVSRYRFDFEEAVKAGLVIPNAGLVLLHPYLLMFFEGLGLLENKHFRDADARQRAVQLLHYLYSGQEVGEEPQMAFNKLLCGMRLSDFVNPNFQLKTSDKEECDHLLAAVIRNWTALKGVSVDGFRRTFIQKKGILGKEQHGWLLRVQRGPVDILLDRLPWSFAVVRLPWNDYLLHVEW